MFGYSIGLGLPIHQAQLKPTRELFVHGSVLQWQSLSYFDLEFFDIEEGSHTWAIGLGVRLWPDQDNRVYVAGAGELLLSNESGGWGILSLEGGVGF